MGKKSAAAAASKISSSSALATTTSTSTTNKSSLLKSSFAPSYLQLRLFASVIQSFECQQLRIHDTSNGRLRQEHSASAGVNVGCLDWGCYGPSHQDQRTSNKKKRKRAPNSQEDAVIAYGTSNSEICMYSPAEGKVIGTLRGGHEREIRDFKFLPSDNLEAWSIGGDDKLVQWNLGTNQPTRTMSLTDPLIRTLALPSRTSPQILCASATPYAINFDTGDDFQIDSFDAFKQPVHTLIRSGLSSKTSEEVFLAADHNRYINIYDISKKKIVRTLVAGGDVDQTDIHVPIEDENQMLAVVTRDGSVEIFSNPFALPQNTNGDLKSQRKGLTRKADATIKLVSSDNSKKHVPVYRAFFEGPNIVIVSVAGGAEPVFQKLRWQDEGNGELLFGGVREVSQARTASSLNTATTNGAKDMGQTHVNEGRTVVVNGTAEPGSHDAPVEIDSSENEDEAASDLEEDIKDEAASDGEDAGSDAEMADADDIEGITNGTNETQDVEPSFGDLLAARHPETISIMDAMPASQNALMKLPESKQAIMPSGMSLGTVLTQSLRTNDQSLLETCLHVTDEHVIQNTILRLDSSLAANLLTKLAERLADRPGRYGHLLTWVQSTMIAHGGAIASQAGVASKLRTLYQVLNERSRVLPSILLLKGKLDMMNAQQTFRAQAEAQRRGIADAPGAIYIEGQEDNWSSDDDIVDERATKSRKAIPRSRKDLDDLIGGPESSDDEDMPLVNGEFHTDDEDESDEDVPHINKPNGILDDEAEVSGEEDDDGESVSGDEEEEDDDNDEENSSLEDFINDGEISMDEDGDDIEVDEELKPPTKKKLKHR